MFYGAGYSSNFLPNNYPFSGKQSNKLSHFCKTNVIVHRELKPHDVWAGRKQSLLVLILLFYKWGTWKIKKFASDHTGN